MRPWYWRLATPLSSFLVPFLLVLLPIGALMAWNIGTGRGGERAPDNTPIATLASLIWGLYGFGASYGYISLQSRLFPPGVFAIGQGIERAHRVAAVRTSILVGIGLSLLVGITGSLIASFAFQAMN